MTISPRMSLVRVALLAGALLACAAPSAHAAAWPGYGGDPGRSGNQPVDAGTVALKAVWERTGAGDKNVKTSIVTSAGSPAAQRVIYGTGDGVVHFRRLSDGVPFGGADVGGDADVFGTQSATPGANGASVSFADTSTATGPGQLFAAHNDGAGIEIAHFNEADGSLVAEFAVPGTTGMTIESSLLATPAASDGSRLLFLVAGGRLFKVPVADAASPSASFGTVTSTADVDANPIASPTLLYLDVVGTPTAHVALGTTDGFLRSYRTSDLAPGPSIDLKIEFGPPPTPPTIAADDVMTPSVPVQPNGAIPGPGSPVEEAQFVYVAASGVFPFFPAGGDDTIAYKLHVVDGAFEFQFEFLPIPDTDPAPALAVSQVADAPDPADAQDAEVLITTTTNLFLATTRDMDLTGEIDFDSALEAGESGFRQTTASTSGPLYYVTNDRGEQIVGRLSDGKAVVVDDFTRDDDNLGATNGGVGQPAISRGYVQFAGPDGVFVYRNTDVTAPAVALTAPAADATVAGTVTVAATASDSRGIGQVEFRANGRSLGTDTTADGESFSVSVDTNGMPAGEYVLDAIATDGSDLTTLSEPRRVVVRSRGEDAPPTVEFARPAAGALLSGSPTLSANASDDHGVASVRFLAGERVVCTDTTAPYECDYRLGADDVGRTTLVAVATDTAGQTGAALRTVRVSRFTPASVSATTAPRRDRLRPFRFTTSGRVRLPSGLTRAQACGSGDVAVVVKAARKTISTRRVQLSRSCTYRSRVTFRSRSRFTRNGRLSVRVRFLGNTVLGPRRAKAVTVRTR